MSPAPPVRIGRAVLDVGARTVRGPGGVADVEPRVARLLARLAEAGGDLVAWPDLGGGAGRAAVKVAAVGGRRALRDAGAGVGIATVKGGPRATGGTGGMRLDPAAADGAVVHQRRDYGGLLAARDAGVPHAELAARFGLASAQVSRNTVLRAKRRARAEAGGDGHAESAP